MPKKAWPAEKTMPGNELARRIADTAAAHPDKRYAFFLGAGCSVSSGIPGAASLVKNTWLPSLRRFAAPKRDDLDAWAAEAFPGYTPDNAAEFYDQVMKRLFLQPDARQTEFERLCDNTFPGFGYAVLAALMANKKGVFNTVLTTNFDDMVADALYLFTAARPLVIPHQSLAGYVRATSTRPLVVKLHGDHRLSPLNTDEETERISAKVQAAVGEILHDRGLIFVGYGGHDGGIAEMLKKLPAEALPLGVFWVSDSPPRGLLRNWLKSRDAVWVQLGDFDKLMLLFHKEFELAHPNKKRFDEVFDNYHKKYSELSARVESIDDDQPDAEALKEAVSRADAQFKDWWGVEVQARKYIKTDPDQADEIYLAGIEKFPESHQLLGNYAVFLKNIREDYDEAEKCYRRALEADPNHANNLGNYAVFLTDIRQDYDEAEKYYRRALEVGPNHANNLGNYASFLYSIREDHDEAEKYYRRAIEVDPNGVKHLGNYAGLLFGLGRGDETTKAWQRAMDVALNQDKKWTVLDLWFVLFANGEAGRRGEALGHIKQLYRAGVRLPGYTFSHNIKRAKIDGHPDLAWLPKLADVIAGKADAAVLDGWDAWPG